MRSPRKGGDRCNKVSIRVAIMPGSDVIPSCSRYFHDISKCAGTMLTHHRAIMITILRQSRYSMVDYQPSALNFHTWALRADNYEPHSRARQCNQLHTQKLILQNCEPPSPFFNFLCIPVFPESGALGTLGLCGNLPMHFSMPLPFASDWVAVVYLVMHHSVNNNTGNRDFERVPLFERVSSHNQTED